MRGTIRRSHSRICDGRMDGTGPRRAGERLRGSIYIGAVQELCRESGERGKARSVCTYASCRRQRYTKSRRLIAIAVHASCWGRSTQHSVLCTYIHVHTFPCNSPVRTVSHNSFLCTARQGGKCWSLVLYSGVYRKSKPRTCHVVPGLGQTCKGLDLTRNPRTVARVLEQSSPA